MADQVYSDEEIVERLGRELPHWHYEKGWIRRKYRTHGWKSTLLVINTVGHLAEAAWQVNERTENIGARRLHTVMERLMEDISFDASEQSGATFVIDTDYVNAHLGKLIEDEDLSRFIL